MPIDSDTRCSRIVFTWQPSENFAFFAFSNQKASEIAQLRGYKARRSFQLVTGDSQAVPR